MKSKTPYSPRSSLVTQIRSGTTPCTGGLAVFLVPLSHVDVVYQDMVVVVLVLLASSLHVPFLRRLRNESLAVESASSSSVAVVVVV